MLEVSRYDLLFATPLMRFRLPDHAIFDAELLLEGQRLRASDAGAAKSNRGGWHSGGNIFDDATPPIARLKSLAEQAVWAVTRRVSPGLDTATLRMSLFGWMNANAPGAFNAPHTHPGAHWSGVYYVTQPRVETGNSGMIEFLDPRVDLPHWRLLQSSTFSPKRRIRPEAGEMILFPSYLVHWVYPNETDEERVSVAFNATFARQRTPTDG